MLAEMEIPNAYLKSLPKCRNDCLEGIMYRYLKRHLQRVKMGKSAWGGKTSLDTSSEQVMSPIMQQYRDIETCIEYSTYKHI
ncbi:hypothetical protein V6N11_025718 [Hibiscus sabdariffa]|uniref:PRONE domain-containing protein n=1 Tax=Hibiscus sabdariffa TaxID=183260 RepID=A0ABR2STU3_9ROSI